MTGELSKVYSETSQAQIHLIALAEALAAGYAPPAVWNAAEECLDAALERFKAARTEAHSDLASKRPSPGQAGGAGGTISASAPVLRLQPAATPADGDL